MVEPEGAEGADQNEPRQVDFTLTPHENATSETTLVEPDKEHKVENLAAKLLCVHHQFNHISFNKLQMMAKAGILPKRLANCQVPVCSACMYGKATRRPWRSKPKSNSPTKEIKYSGQCVSVDMLKSPTPGLIAQMAGWITAQSLRTNSISRRP